MNFQIPGHIMRWLGPIVIVNAFIWVVTWTPEAQYALCSRTENCLISWIGALSGWAAAAAAGVTLFALYDQLSEMRRATATTALIQLLPARRRAKHVAIAATNLMDRFARYESGDGPMADIDWKRGLLRTKTEMRGFAHELDREEFQSSSAEYGTAKTAKTAVVLLGMAIERMDNHFPETGEQAKAFFATWANPAMSNAKGYLSQLIEGTKDTQIMIDEILKRAGIEGDH